MNSRLLRTLFALIWLITSIFLLVSLISHNPKDPSFNKATSALATNWGGYYGAYVSDPLLSLLGYASFLIALFFMSLAYQYFSSPRSINLTPRLIVLLLTAPLLSTALASFNTDYLSREEYGGFMGAFLSSEIDLLTDFWWWGIILLSLIIPLILYCLNIPFKAFLNCIISIFSRVAKTTSDAKEIGEHIVSRSKSLRAVKRRISLAEDDVAYDETASNTHIEIVSKPKSEPSTSKIQARLKLSEDDEYELPSLKFLKVNETKKTSISESSLAQNSKILQQVLEDFGIRGDIIKIHPGPVVTLYEFEPAAGIKSSRIIGLADDISRSMSAVSARISVIPGKSSLGIELPNSHREIVLLRELLETKDYSHSADKLPLILGKNIGGEPIIADLSRMPHLLVAGTTGSGKSVAINTMILSLLYKHSPKTCKFIMIDPKMLELSIYDGIPHLLAPVVTEPSKAVAALKWVVKEMENRYRMMSTAGVRNIDGYNKEITEAAKHGKKFERQIQVGFDPETGKPKYETVSLDSNPLPFIVVIVDEMADLMLVAGKDIEGSIQRLAQMARAAGIHIIMATQRPSVDVITGVIKANFPTRISFQVTSKIDSRTILGEQGAEQLLGMGDMLFMRGGGRIERVHGPFVSDREIQEIVSFIKAQGSPQYVETVTQTDDDDGEFSGQFGDSEDDLYNQAVRLVLRDKKASTSYIQRCLRIGYNRAATIIEKMEKEGIVSAPNHVGKRDIIIGGEEA